ncbi:DUF5722 domain-containing protein [Granulosicoccaceae sp. 1_MG-2023]|nr:DUF5722 domain-containing protein [Granulosicoccaceae sp. 1_MG-2023]
MLRHQNPFALCVIASALLLSACGTESQSTQDSGAAGTVITDANVLIEGDTGTIETGDMVVAEEVEVLNGSLPYPERDAFSIKAIQTDGWEKQDFVDANVGGVAVNFSWLHWQPSEKTGTCNTANEFSYDGYCFRMAPSVDEEIRFWTENDVLVTGIVVNVPEWATDPETCTQRKNLCAPADSADFARFAGMLAERYNGLNGNGRVADFVINNEVNMNSWYNIGCGYGVACDVDAWVQRYASDYNAAYDEIIAHQPAAKVFISFAHYFEYADLERTWPIVAVKPFLKRFAELTGDRKWRVAFHPYPPNLKESFFSPDDLPRITYGNIGILAAWLRSEFPLNPEAWELHLTESGINSLWTHSSEEEQAEALCDSYRNVLGTPGIENYVYHRMVDHTAEVAVNTAFGLATEDGELKQAWDVWSTMSGRNGERTNLDCGFEDVPYTRVTQYTHDERENWVSSRRPPEGYTAQQSWRMMRDYEEGTYMIYECGFLDGTYLSSDIECGGEQNYGPVGYIFTEQVDNTTPLYSCIADNSVYSASGAQGCGNNITRQFLGYAVKP